MAALYENHQWAVTEDGIESIKPGFTYPIEAHRLLERHGVGEGKLYDWPVHMAKKTWVDIEAFIDAFSGALRLYAGSTKVRLILTCCGRRFLKLGVKPRRGLTRKCPLARPRLRGTQRKSLRGTRRKSLRGSQRKSLGLHPVWMTPG